MTNSTSKLGDIEVYEAMPSGKVRGAVIVIHEVWALNDHTRDIANRLAGEGYIALAPNLLEQLDVEGHAAQLQLDLFNPEKRNAMQTEMRRYMAPLSEPGFAEKTLGRLQICFDYLYDLPESQQHVAVMGYCFGGSYSYSLTAIEPQLSAAIPYYGHPPDASGIANIKCPVLAFYGENDHGLVDGLDDLRRDMQQADVDYQAVVYPGCGHAFFNDTNPYAYNETAAKDSWAKVLQFLADNLG